MIVRLWCCCAVAGALEVLPPPGTKQPTPVAAALPTIVALPHAGEDDAAYVVEDTLLVGVPADAALAPAGTETWVLPHRVATAARRPPCAGPRRARRASSTPRRRPRRLPARRRRHAPLGGRRERRPAPWPRRGSSTTALAAAGHLRPVARWTRARRRATASARRTPAGARPFSGRRGLRPARRRRVGVRARGRALGRARERAPSRRRRRRRAWDFAVLPARGAPSLRRRRTRATALRAPRGGRPPRRAPAAGARRRVLSPARFRARQVGELVAVTPACSSAASAPSPRSPRRPSGRDHLFSAALAARSFHELSHPRRTGSCRRRAAPPPGCRSRGPASCASRRRPR